MSAFVWLDYSERERRHGIAIGSRLQDRRRTDRVSKEAQHRNAAATFSDAPVVVGVRSRCTGKYVDDRTTAAPVTAYGFPRLKP